MCSTPWSASASITISAPVISRPGAAAPLTLHSSSTPLTSISFAQADPGNQKGAQKPLFPRTAEPWEIEPPQGGAPSYDNQPLSNFIAHLRTLSPFRCVYRDGIPSGQGQIGENRPETAKGAGSGALSVLLCRDFPRMSGEARKTSNLRRSKIARLAMATGLGGATQFVDQFRRGALASLISWSSAWATALAFVSTVTGNGNSRMPWGGGFMIFNPASYQSLTSPFVPLIAALD